VSPGGPRVRIRHWLVVNPARAYELLFSQRHQCACGGRETGVAPLNEGEALVERRVERDGGETVAVAEGIEKRSGHECVAETARGELEGGIGVLDLDGAAGP
jgi:hypothetical protein